MDQLHSSATHTFGRASAPSATGEVFSYAYSHDVAGCVTSIASSARLGGGGASPPGGPCAHCALTDHQNTVHGFADTNGAVVVRYAYDAWGNLLSEESSVPALASNRYRFQGREYSTATGLVNFRARWYDSETGRWLSKDPIGIGGGLNLYAFCGDDAENTVDPRGMNVFW